MLTSKEPATGQPADPNHIAVPIPTDEELVILASMPSPDGGLEKNTSEVGSSRPSTSSNDSSKDGSEIKAEDNIPVVPKAPVVHKWYFKATSGASDDETKLRYECCADPQSTIRVNLSTRFTSWTFPTEEIESGLYDVVIGLTTTKETVDLIETLTFRFTTVDGHSIAPTERIWKEQLKTMCGTAHDPAKWRLCLQLEQTKKIDKLIMEMEIRPSYDAAVNGHLELNFMELHTSENADLDQDSSVLSHEPWMWSLDVHDDSKTAAPKTIIHYAFSGDKSHVAILSVSGNGMILELWHICDSDDSGAAAERNGTSSEARSICPSQQSARCGIVQVAGAQLQDHYDVRESFSVSTSWNGSQVALLDARHLKKGQKSLFAIYRHDHFNRLLAPDSKQSDLFHYNVPFRGKFHVIAPSSQDAAELFLACAREKVIIFRVLPTNQEWIYLYTISNVYTAGRNLPPQSYGFISYATDASDPTTFDDKYFRSFRQLAASCLGQYFVWDATDYISVWDMTQKSPISLKVLKDAAGPAVCSISDDNSMLAVLSGNVVTINEMASGLEIGSTHLEGYSFTEVRFIRDDSQLLVQSSNTCSEFKGEHYGLILDRSGLFIVNKILIPGYCIDVEKSLGPGDRFYAAHGSRLYRLQLEDCILNQYSQPYIPSCDGTCKDNLTVFGDHATTYRARNGLQFTATWEQDERRTTAAVVRVAVGDGLKASRLLLIPFEKHSSGGRVAVFLDKLHRLLVADGDIIMVCGLPESEDGDLTLLFLGHRRGVWGICQHQQLLWRDSTLDEDQPAAVQRVLIEPPYSGNDGMHFLEGFKQIFNLDLKDRKMKERVERYIDQHINRRWHCDSGEIDVLSHLWGHYWSTGAFRNRNLGRKILYLRFTAFAFKSSCIQWYPRSNMDKKTNPVLNLLLLAITDPQGLQYLEIAVDYCFRRARAGKDLQILLPVMQTLYGQIHYNFVLADLAPRVLRRLVHFPVKSRDFLLRNHVASFSPGLQWCVSRWKPIAIYRLKSPIVQVVCLEHSLKSPGSSIQGDFFTRDLFAASFDSLWHFKDGSSLKSFTESDSMSSYALSFWIRSFLNIARNKLSLVRAETVEAYDFDLDVMDNPDIVALITYKWNTIGFNYWLVRFLSQCSFYALVLTAVFKQIYGDHTHPSMALFVVILLLSSIFLWREVAQMIISKRRYFSSAYNIVDLAVFGLPFAGSVNQLMIMSGSIQGSTAREGNVGIFSFAAIFIFLHILFELRVNGTVCKFVTIITGAIGKIRVFFFIFAAGVLAFTIATLHILRGCPFEDCVSPTTKLPLNFFYALSATYFVMGGRYDAVNEDFDSENWQFHALMMVYFFFTVILMLNVLIALINGAFNDGDETWRRVWNLNRLKVVEGAENLSYHISGFRQNSPWFPREIYYSATKQQIKEYAEKYPSVDNQEVVDENKSQTNNPEDPWTLLQTQQAALKQDMANMQGQSKEQLERLQGQGDALRKQNGDLVKLNDDLNDRLKGMQESFNTQTTALMALIDDMRQRLPLPSS